MIFISTAAFSSTFCFKIMYNFIIKFYLTDLELQVEVIQETDDIYKLEVGFYVAFSLYTCITATFEILYMIFTRRAAFSSTFCFKIMINFIIKFYLTDLELQVEVIQETDDIYKLEVGFYVAFSLYTCITATFEILYMIFIRKAAFSSTFCINIMYNFIIKFYLTELELQVEVIQETDHIYKLEFGFYVAFSLYT